MGSTTFGSMRVRIGYEELIDALNNVLISPDNPADVYELALSYRNTIRQQFSDIKTAYNRPERDRIFYYSLYYKFKQSAPNYSFAIYGANNPGGEVSILNNTNWQKLRVVETDVLLFYELVDAILCFKFKAITEDHTIKYKIRDILRDAMNSIVNELISKGVEIGKKAA